MAIVLDRFTVDGDVFDVLEDCDQLSLGLGRLRRQGRISEQDWRSSAENLTAICARIETCLAVQGVAARLERQDEVRRSETATPAGHSGTSEGHGSTRVVGARQSPGGQDGTDAAIQCSLDQPLAPAPHCVPSTTRHSLMRILVRPLRAWWAGLTAEDTESTMPRIRWP